MKVDPHLSSRGSFTAAYEAGRTVALAILASRPGWSGHIEQLRARSQLNALTFEIRSAESVYDLHGRPTWESERKVMLTGQDLRDGVVPLVRRRS